MPCGCPRNVISGSESEHVAAAYRRLERRRAPFEVVLSPRPAAAKRAGRVEPHHRADPLRHGVRLQAEHRVVVEEYVDVLLGAGCGRRRRVDRDAQHRAGHVELVGAEPALLLARLALDEIVRDRQIQQIGDRSRGRSGGDDRAAGLDELLDVGFRAGAAARAGRHLAEAPEIGIGGLAAARARRRRRFGVTSASAATPAAAPAAAGPERRARRHDDHVVLRPQRRIVETCAADDR